MVNTEQGFLDLLNEIIKELNTNGTVEEARFTLRGDLAVSNIAAVEKICAKSPVGGWHVHLYHDYNFSHVLELEREANP